MKIKIILLLCIFSFQYLLAQEVEANGTWYNRQTKEMIMIDFDLKEKVVKSIQMAKENKFFSTMKILSQSAISSDGYSEEYVQVKIQFVNPEFPTKIYNLYTFDEKLGVCIYLKVNDDEEQKFYLIGNTHTINSKKTNNDIAYNLGLLICNIKPQFELVGCYKMDIDYWKKKGVTGKLKFEFKDNLSIVFIHENGKEEKSTLIIDPTLHTFSFTLPTFGKVMYDFYLSFLGSKLEGKNEKGEEINFMS